MAQNLQKKKKGNSASVQEYLRADQWYEMLKQPSKWFENKQPKQPPPQSPKDKQKYILSGKSISYPNTERTTSKTEALMEGSQPTKPCKSIAGNPVKLNFKSTAFVPSATAYYYKDRHQQFCLEPMPLLVGWNKVSTE